MIEKDTFYNLTIAGAAYKFLEMCNKKPQHTNAVIDALEKGGLKRSRYQTVYSVLSRRQWKKGDIVNVNGDWALQEWYGPIKPKQSGKKKKEDEGFSLSDDPVEITADGHRVYAEAVEGAFAKWATKFMEDLASRVTTRIQRPPSLPSDTAPGFFRNGSPMASSTTLRAFCATSRLLDRFTMCHRMPHFRPDLSLNFKTAHYL